MAENTVPAVPEEPVDTTVHVRITVDPNSTSRVKIDTGGRPLPNTKVAASFLTATQIAFLKKMSAYKYNYNLTELVYASKDRIPYPDWADAIAQALMIAIANENPAESSNESIINGAYLAMGDSLYKVSVVGKIDATKALHAARAKAMDKLKIELKAIKDTSKQAADTLVADAQRLHEEAKRAREKAGHFPNPELVKSGFAFRQASNNMNYHDEEGRSAIWEVGMVIDFWIEEFFCKANDKEETTVHWPALDADLMKIYMWFPFNTKDGIYSITAARVDQASLELPHVSYEGSCMGPQGLPKLIKTKNDLILLKQQVERTMTGVNLDSLFRYPEVWSEYLSQFIPEDLMTCFKANPYDKHAYRVLATETLKKAKEAEKLAARAPELIDLYSVPDIDYESRDEGDKETWTT